jgi:hypothetical protein
MIIGMMSAWSQAKTEQTASQMLEELQQIIANTDWDNEAASERATLRIEQLTKAMGTPMPEKKEDPPEHPNNAAGCEEPGFSGDGGIARRKDEVLKMLWEIGATGEHYPDLDLAKPVRDDIVKEYEDERKKYSHPGLFNELGFLLIDFSEPKTMAAIPKMNTYTGVKTLIITGGKNHVAPVNLSSILASTSSMKLDQLFIINFKNHLTELPASIANQRQLEYLGLFNNQLTELPPAVFGFSSLKTLHIDLNPISELPSFVANLVNLQELGIAGTQLDAKQHERLKQYLPNCKILSE